MNTYAGGYVLLAGFACMLLIRHKTLHRIFMFGIPAVMVLQAAILLGIHHILLARGFL